MQPQIPLYRRLFKLLVFVGVLVMLNFGGNWLLQQIDFQLFPRHEALMHLMVMGAIALYVLLMAIPFMPGIEIGLALMVLLGNKGALLIYLCTLAALSISYAIGSIIPSRYLIALLDWLHLERASALLTRLEPLERKQRLDLLIEQAPRRLVPLLLRHRYLAMAVLLNLPGNALIGGGGGIGMIAGMSRLFPYPLYLSTTALAVAPVPILFYFEIVTPWTG